MEKMFYKTLSLWRIFKDTRINGYHDRRKSGRDEHQKQSKIGVNEKY